MPKPPALVTAAASAGVAIVLPMPACWIGTAQPTSSVNRVVSMARLLYPGTPTLVTHSARLARHPAQTRSTETHCRGWCALSQELRTNCRLAYLHNLPRCVPEAGSQLG